MNEALIWTGIALCLSQSATLSGLNLAVFSQSRLRLEAAAAAGDLQASRVLALRHDANQTLATILWGNVAVNVLLTLLAESVLVGIAAFAFSTVVITIAGEILPQAYFVRRALRVVSALAPLLAVYRVLLWPLAWPSGKVLDRLVGRESVPWLREHELRDVLHHHAREPTSEVGPLEARGAVNFLALDDLPIEREGELIDPRSIVSLPFEGARPRLPTIKARTDDAFLRQVAASGKKWVVLTDTAGEPRMVLNAHALLRGALFGSGDAEREPLAHCHRPLVVRDGSLPLGNVLGKLVVRAEHPGDDVIDQDLILLWGDEKRIVTGSDILGRLLRGIASSVIATQQATTNDPRSPAGKSR
jgi:metal transporter CNNM